MKYFKHGDNVKAADLNALVTAINLVETQTGGFSSYSFGGRDAVIAGTEFYGVHNRRWLLSQSKGEVRSMDFVPNPDPDNDEPIAGYRAELPDCNEAFCMFDLHTVGWLKYGDWYAVEGSEYALETDTNA